jgi:hypothetical protein
MKLLVTFILFSYLCSGCKNENKVKQPAGSDNIAYKWGKISLDATADNTDLFRPRPTITSRMLALVWTSVYDAWSRFDSTAEPVYLKNVARMTAGKRNLKNKEAAISYAAYRALMEYYSHDSVMLTSKMKEFGFDPSNNSLDPLTPEGIGNLAARCVFEARIHDGANQDGSINNSGVPYSDYLGYSPANTADTLNVLARWQPKYFSDGKGGKFAPSCLTPYWHKTKTLLLDSANEFRSPPPPAIGSEQLREEVKQVIELQANLTNEQKALVEFMRDGPKSVQQAGHWMIFAQNVSVRDQHTLDDDIKMYFLVTAAAMDAFIACWDTKMTYDFARPFALIHSMYKGKKIKGWAGPGKGITEISGEDWVPYSPETFVCPPFPSYISGHSTVSGACSEVLKLFTGSDFFGEEVKRVPGELTEPDIKAKEITLIFPTFSETANMAGLSRVLGGYHIPCENTEGLKLGRKVAAVIWNKYLGYIHGDQQLAKL